MKKEFFLIKANKSSRCHNPLKSMDSSATFSRQTTQSGNPVSNTFDFRFHVLQGCLHIITLLSLVFIFVYFILFFFLGGEASVLKEIQPNVKQLNSHLGWSRPTR